MKKLLFLTLALALLASCKKDETPNLDNNETPNPDNSALVSGIVMPTGELRANDFATIKGKGFVKGDTIALRAAVKSSDINVVVTEVTESQLVFKLPVGVAAGKTNVVLKRDVREQILGEVTIAKILPPQIYGTTHEYSKEGSTYNLYQINATTGISTHITTLPDSDYRRFTMSIGHTLYAIDAEGIVSYNIDTKELKYISKEISSQRGGDVLGVINGKLHVLAIVDDIVKLVSIDPVTSAQTEVVNFGQIQDPASYPRFFSFADFSYDATTNRIAIVINWERTANIAVLDLSKKVIEYHPLPLVTSYVLFRGSQLILCSSTYESLHISLLNDQYKADKLLFSMPSGLGSPRCAAYDALQDMGYLCIGTDFCTIDMAVTPVTMKVVAKEVQKFYDLVVVR